MAIIGYWNSLTEAERLTQTVLLRGIVEEIIEEGQQIATLPILQIDGKDLGFNREIGTPSADFYDVGEEIASQASEAYTPVSISLKRAIGQWDLDHFVTGTYKNVNDLRAVAITRTRKGVMRVMEDKLIYGDNGANAKEFDGWQNLCAAAMRINQGSGSTGAALSLANLDVLIDSVKPKPDMLLMTFALNRRLSAVGRGGTTSIPVIQMPESPGGDVQPMITSYRGVPIVRSDFMLQTETIASGDFSAKTGGATSSVIAIRKGEVEDGGCSLLTGSPAFELREWDHLENKDAGRIRLVWYVSLINGSTKAIGIIDGITDVAVVE